MQLRIVIIFALTLVIQNTPKKAGLNADQKTEDIISTLPRKSEGNREIIVNITSGEIMSMSAITIRV